MQSFEEQVEQRRKAALERISKIPIAALIWGPDPSLNTPVSNARQELRDTLTRFGHMARYSEELVDQTLPHSLMVQQIAQAEAFDVVFSIPDSPGSIAEIHDFARLPHLSHKIIAFLNNDWNDGYSNRSLIELQSVATCQVQLYDSNKLPSCIIDPAVDLVRRLQEVYYTVGRRLQ